MTKQEQVETWRRERTKLLPKNIYLCARDNLTYDRVVVPLAKTLREKGLCVETPRFFGDLTEGALNFRGTNRHVELAEKLGFGYFILLGEKDSVEGPFAVKPLTAGNQGRLASFEKILTLEQTIAMARHPYTEQYQLDDDGNPVPVADLLGWGTAMRTRHAKFNLKHYCWWEGLVPFPFASVSTVFLGLDHSFGRSRPLLYETMIFGGPLSDEQWRYATEKEARAGHKKAVLLAWTYPVLFWRHEWFLKLLERLIKLFYRPEPEQVLEESVKELKERAKDDPVSTEKKD